MSGSLLKITLRKLYREKTYALINIAGLSLGIACCVILGLYLRSELTYDQHYTNHKNIYRIVNEFNANGKLDSFAYTSAVLGPMLLEEYPDVLDYVRFRPIRNLILIYEDKSYNWENVYFVDENIFDVFNHEIIYGDPETAMSKPFNVAVSETFAKRYFGDENPIGKVIQPENGTPNTIALVFADQPENTHLKYDVLLTYDIPVLQLPDSTAGRRQRLGNTSDYTYLVMPDDYDVADYLAISRDFYIRHMEDRFKTMNMSWRSWLQPLAEIHLYSDVGADLPTGNRLYLYGFASVAVFILVVACINYMNLATARYSKRAREVGMRKILGASRGRLTLQFLGEALCFTFISAVIGVMLVELVLALTPITSLLGKELPPKLSGEPVLLGWLFGLSLLIGLCSGLYPAFYLSSVAPLKALSTATNTGKLGIRLREMLVLVQFTISVGVIACTLLMAVQMRYVSEKSLGFDKENRVVINMRGADLLEKIPTLRTELMKNSNILGITTSNSIMGKQFPTNTMPIENNDGVREMTAIEHTSVDGNFFEVMGIQLKEGRDFSTRLLTDVGGTFVVNEAMVEMMGWDEPLGKFIQMGANAGKVIGVVKNFHFDSLHNTIGPFVLYPFNDNFATVNPEFRPFLRRNMVLNISGENIRETLEFVEGLFAEFDPEHTFEFEFLDDSLDELYISEERLMKLTGIFAGICIFIACMGLYGLTAFTTEQRTREIGIRKVIGASTSQIIMLLARNILLLVLTGAVIASLVSWYVMQDWLAGFAYRTTINPAIFLLSAAAAAAIAYITLALQSYKTVEANPVHALRYE